MLNITNNQRKTNQNHNEISPHTCQNGYYQKDKKQQMYKDLEKRESSCTVAGDINLYSHYGKEDGGSSKIKNIITIWSSNSTYGYLSKQTYNH